MPRNEQWWLWRGSLRCYYTVCGSPQRSTSHCATPRSALEAGRLRIRLEEGGDREVKEEEVACHCAFSTARKIAAPQVVRQDGSHNAPSHQRQWLIGSADRSIARRAF